MTSTIIIPSESMISIPVPRSYIGKQVEIVFSVVNESPKHKPEKRLSEMFRGALSKESAESFINHTKSMRNEW